MALTASETMILCLGSDLLLYPPTKYEYFLLTYEWGQYFQYTQERNYEKSDHICSSYTKWPSRSTCVVDKESSVVHISRNHQESMPWSCNSHLSQPQWTPQVQVQNPPGWDITQKPLQPSALNPLWELAFWSYLHSMIGPGSGITAQFPQLTLGTAAESTLASEPPMGWQRLLWNHTVS